MELRGVSEGVAKYENKESKDNKVIKRKEIPWVTSYQKTICQRLPDTWTCFRHFKYLLQRNPCSLWALYLSGGLSLVVLKAFLTKILDNGIHTSMQNLVYCLIQWQVSFQDSVYKPENLLSASQVRDCQ